MSSRVFQRFVLSACVAFVVLVGAPLVSVAASEVTVIQPERDFAYTLGDVLVQRIVLPESSAQPDLSVLDSAARVSDWLERQEATLLQVGDQRLLQLRYQIVNVPESIRLAELPALSVSMSDGSTIKWQAWPFSLGPLVADTALVVGIQGGQPTLVKADEHLVPIDTQTLRHRLFLTGGIMAIFLLCWFVWWLWRSQRDRHRLPFARAVHELKRQRSGADPETLEAWRIVHEAFNSSAGQVVTGSDVGGLIKHLPWLTALGSQVDDFFTESSSRFFSQPPMVKPFDLVIFAKRLAAEEKRHAV